jgi:hypothetical protein
MTDVIVGDTSRSEGTRRAVRVADEQASEMRRKLAELTPVDMGFPDITAEELIESEWCCWFDEEMREQLRTGACD